MGDQSEKPAAFRPGATSISAAALNDLRNAIPRLLKGGAGVVIEKYGDRYIVRLEDQQGSAPGAIAIAVITAIKDTYLECDKDGATINVAKPWALRRGVDWPSPPSYTYSAPGTRSAVQIGFTTETQKITPDYEVNEEILIVRLPAARIEDDDGGQIRWVDLNTAGRCWAKV